MSLNLDEFIWNHFRFQNKIENLNKQAKYKNIDEFHELCTRAIAVFSAEPSLVKMNRSCAVVGSLYGSFRDLIAVQAVYTPTVSKLNYGLLTENYVFLGNYVDYGNQSLETLALLLALKIRQPDHLHLLRGSHECSEINRTGGFYDELVGRFGADVGEKLFNHFNEVFSWMPLAGVIGEKIFCVHGGLSPHLRSLEDIEKIPRPLTDPFSNPLAANLLWSEYDEKTTGFRIHPKRDFAVLFGGDNVAKFCNDTDIQLIVRGGDKPPPMSFPTRPIISRQLIALFGNACFGGNTGSVSMDVDEDLQCSFAWIRPPPENLQQK